MVHLFESASLGKLNLKNRFVRSAVCEGTAGPDGEVTPRLRETLIQLADGGAGLIITGHANVEKRGWGGPGQLGLQEDRLIPGLKEMVDALHRRDVLVIPQLAHQGAWAASDLSGSAPLAPSPVEGAPGSRAMTVREIHETAENFGAAARRAKEAGFDGVQIHTGHGYLLSEFLSPFYNRRRDEYGGSLPNRARFLLEVIRAVRKEVGRDYTVIVKINSDDFLDGGFGVEEMLAVCSLLEEAGIDGIELSGGSSDSRARFTPARAGKKSGQGWYREAARRLKDCVALPVILVGGNHSSAVARELLNDGVCDFVSMGRPLVREPDLINKWRKDENYEPACVFCNGCFGPLSKGLGSHCVLEEK